MIVISKKDERYWGSCDEIELAFESVIDKLKKTIKVEHIQYTELNLNEKIQDIRKLIKQEYNTIYFLSHNIDFNIFLDKFNSHKEVLNLLIPVYGDMTIQVNRWLKAHHKLKGWKTKLIVASEASRNQIANFIQNDEALNVIKHPLRKEYFLTKEIDKDTKTLKYLYAGRISLGKNIFAMMDDFIKASKLKNNIELSIYGRIDSVGYRFHNYTRQELILEKEFKRILSESNGVIKYYKHVNSNEMIQVYRGHDYFVSMSTYQDEDYGLAVAQAIASGCYPIISDWGGYRSFGCAQKVNVKLMSNFHFIYERKKLIQYICNPPEIESEILHQYSIENFSVSAIANQILELLKKKNTIYTGQTEFFFKYRELYKINSGQPYINIKNSKEVESLYKRVYHSYYA